MKLLVRLPNWLGDLVMSAPFLRALRAAHPEAAIHLVVKDTLLGLVPLLPGGPWAGVHAFSKTTWPGALGPWRLGRHLRRLGGGAPFDAYFALPNSWSAALLGVGSGAVVRVGFRGEAGALFTVRHPQPGPAQHRAAAYRGLVGASWLVSDFPLETAGALLPPAPSAHQAIGLNANPPPRNALVVNPNSEAQSRRLPPAVAARVLAVVAEAFSEASITLIGAPRERAHVQAVIEAAPVARQPLLRNAAGTTDLPGLAAQLAAARLLVTSDSGPAHLAAALGTPVVVLFGQGFEAQTAPLGPGPVRVVRAPGPRPCGGCPPNRCRFPGAPPCLAAITEDQLRAAVQGF